MITTLAAALPTNQSPPATSIGAPLREYGSISVAIMGNRENMANPAPSAPLRNSLVLSKNDYKTHGYL